MKRGEIYYIQRPDTYGCEIRKSRPAIIVSNDALNDTAGVVEVVYLTTSPRKELPTHAHITSSGVESTALCEQIDSVSFRLVGHYCGACTPEEMAAVDRALVASLDLAKARGSITDRAVASEQHSYELARLHDELEQVKAERDRYVKIVEALLGGTR
jgi:mRNA interferase MazF